MTNRLSALLLILALWPSSTAWTQDKPSAATFRVVGYIPDYRAGEFDFSSARRLTDLIVFSVQPTATGQLDLSRLKTMPWEKLRTFKTKERVRLILCVGGWERSTQFPTVVANRARRQAFVDSAVKVCLEERLDGIDLDWEHPKDEAEQAGYAQLLAELKQAFQPHGLTLSLTMAAWQKLPRTAFQSVDWVQVMSYDNPGRHSTFEAAQADVQKLIAAGAPVSKITLGLPFYGRDVSKAEQALTYREIMTKHQPKKDVDEVGPVFFNGPALIRRKTEYALKSRLAGVMVWELGQDAIGDQSLLKVIRSTVDLSAK